MFPQQALTRPSEKHALAEEAEKLASTIKQMHIGLEGKGAEHELDEAIQVTYPLKPCIQSLKERHKAVSKAHRERFEQVKSKPTAFPKSQASIH